MAFTTPSALRKAGVIGMNHRNASYIARYNSRKLYPTVDDKFTTKKLAGEWGIEVPELYGVVSYSHQVKGLQKLLEPYSQFVIKPSQGSAGKGILVILDQKDGQYFKPSGETVSITDIHRHVNNTLSGLYSLGGRNDTALIEYAVKFTEAFNGFSFQGVPDVRVIVFQGYPVMAMMRLSTKVSDGKANLHQGAVGVGIDLVTGHAKSAVQFNKPVSAHPDTERKLSELIVPQWDELMLLASRCYEMTGLGYFGADIVLDKELGPLILELNARPGLAIQVANQAGLLPRLQLVEEITSTRSPQHQVPGPQARVDFAQSHWG